MRLITRWIRLLFGGLIALVILAALGIYIYTNSRINHTYEFELQPIAIPTDEAALAQGEHIAIIRGCTGCHDISLQGKVVIDGPPGLIVSSNLTGGEGGISADYSDEEWVRAIRHGIGRNNKPLIFMPSHEFYFLSDEDLGALIAYLKSVPPVDHVLPESTARPLGRLLYMAGQFDLLPAEKIDHTAPRPVAPNVAVTIEYGANLALGCIGCHGDTLSGGTIPGVSSEWPEAANLTPAGPLADWSEDDFITTLRTGVNPINHEINPEYMPWQTIGQMSDDELKALWLYLQSLPPTIGRGD